MPPKGMPIGAQAVGQHVSVAPVILLIERTRLRERGVNLA